MVWTPEWTGDPLPRGVTAFLGPVCGCCATHALDVEALDGMPAPLTRSTQPDPANGRYLVQPHQRWCPVWTGETPALPCPRCGAPVEEMEAVPGVSVAVPHPVFGVAHLVGPADEVYANPQASGFGAGSPKLEPSLDQAVVYPCGDVLRGAEAHQVRTRFAQLQVDRHHTEADAVIAAAQELLDSAEAAGRPDLAAAYREAVYQRSNTVPGLLVALQLLAAAGGRSE